MDFKSINYKIDAYPIKYFPQENVFSTEDEAKKARKDWLNNIKDKQHEEDSSIPSILPYPNSESGAETYRVSVLRRRSS